VVPGPPGRRARPPAAGRGRLSRVHRSGHRRRSAAASGRGRDGAIDDLLAAGTITEDEAEQYRAALEEAFTFRVDWDGEEATPTFTGLAA
jgi:hypothetical protein